MTYTVSVTCDFFDAESPQDAANMMILWLIDDCRHASYKVIGEDGTVHHIDGYNESEKA